MNKFSIWFLFLLAVTLFTACNDDDDPVNKQTVNVDINSRTMDGDNAVFSQNMGTIEINSTDATIKITCGYKDADGVGHTLTTSTMTLTPLGGYIYSFGGTSQPYSSTMDLHGIIDLATVTVWFTFTDDGSKVISTTQPIYSYTTTTVTNPDNGNHNSYTNSQYMFELDTKGEKCTMWVTNFAPNLTGSIQSTQPIRWEGLTVTPTATGYVITTDSVESYIKSNGTLTDVKFTLDDQCRSLNGSFKCNGLNIDVAGSLFPSLAE